jgi:hypothetical protein
MYTLDRGELSASGPGRLTSGETAPGAHWIGDFWSHSRPGFFGGENKLFPLPGIEFTP